MYIRNEYHRIYFSMTSNCLKQSGKAYSVSDRGGKLDGRFCDNLNLVFLMCYNKVSIIFFRRPFTKPKYKFNIGNCRRKFLLSNPEYCNKHRDKRRVGRPTRQRSASTPQTSSQSFSSSSPSSCADSYTTNTADSSNDDSLQFSLVQNETLSEVIASEVPVLGCQTLLQSIVSHIYLPSSSWINQYHGCDHAAICKVSDQPCSSHQTFCVIISLRASQFMDTR